MFFKKVFITNIEQVKVQLVEDPSAPFNAMMAFETPRHLNSSAKEELSKLLKSICLEPVSPEVQKVVNPVILDDRKCIQNKGLAENISKT